MIFHCQIWNLWTLEWNNFWRNVFLYHLEEYLEHHRIHIHKKHTGLLLSLELLLVHHLHQDLVLVHCSTTTQNKYTFENSNHLIHMLWFWFSYLEADIVSCEVSCQHSKREAISSASCRFCCVIPFNWCVLISSSLHYNVCLVLVNCNFFPAYLTFNQTLLKLFDITQQNNIYSY